MEKRKAQEGSVHIFLIALGVIFIVAFIIFGAVYTNALMVQMNSLKSRCDFANLAAYADIDQTDLSESGQITFEDSDLAGVYSTYVKYLKKNLNLDDNLAPLNSSSDISAPYKINRLILYSFKNNLITEYEYDNSTNSFTTVLKDSDQAVKTPSGKSVTDTSIYTEVTFHLRLPFNYDYTGNVASYTGAKNK